MIFNRNNKDEFEKQLIETLNGINDTLNNNGFEDKLNDTECRLMEEIRAVNSNFDNLKKGVNEYTKTIGNLCNRIDEQDKIINNLTRDADENYRLIINQEKQIKKLISIVEKYSKLFEIKKSAVPDKIKPNKEKAEYSMIKAYGKNWTCYNYLNLKNIIKFDNKGNFLREGRGDHKYKWNIYTLLKLKELMKKEDEYPTLNKLASKIGLSSTTVNELGYYILNGDFDKYFDEWEQIDANNTYGNWKPSIENNPQKRKEKGYC